MSPSFVEHVLPSGLRIVCEVTPQVRSAAAAFLVRTGARDEPPAEHGVSHFLEHMCFKGTARRTSHQVNVRFDELGSIYNAYTSKDHTIYYGWVPAGRLEEQIELLADLMQPTLPADEFETERQVILEEIAMNDDSFDRQVWNFLHQVVFGKHPLAHEVLGEKATIQALPHAVLCDYHRVRYAPDNIALIAAGAIEPEAVFAAAGRYCSAWSGRSAPRVSNQTPPAWPTGPHRLKLDRFQEQSVLLLYPSIPRGHPLEETVEALVTVLGGHNSRCYWNIVQKGICTEAGASWVAYQDCGLLVVHATGQPERCEQMLEALRTEVARLAADGVRPEELRRVKNQRRTHLALEAESPRTRVMQLAGDLLTYARPRTAHERLAAVEAVNQRTVATYLECAPLNRDPLLLSCGPRDWP